MKAAIYISRAPHHEAHAQAMAEGLARHNINTTFFSTAPEPADFHVFWGWRVAENYRNKGYNILVMERGYIGDRFKWTSLGWNGLNGRATWNKPHDDGGRFNRNFSSLVCDYNSNRNGYALIIGQVPGDMSIKRVNMADWYNRAFLAMERKFGNGNVKFRQHPVAKQRGFASPFPSLDGDLKDALAGAKIVVTFNSNTGVDALLAGVPTIACDHGSMAWPVANHGIDDTRLEVRDRRAWLNALAWKQWTLEEIASGFAWDCIKPEHVAAKPKTVLVLGGGDTVWLEAERAFLEYEIDYVIAINNCVADYPGRIDAALTLHPVKMQEWLETRSNRKYPSPRYVVAHEDRRGKREYPCINKVIPYMWPEMRYSGSSGLFAVKTAFELFSADKVILAGVPMSVGSDHYHKPGIPWKDADAFWPAWQSTFPRLVGKVKSFSGRTAQLLGQPSKEWATSWL